MTKAEAELVVRELVDRYQADPFSMPASVLDRLAEAVQILGQQRVFDIVQEYRRQRGA